MWWPTDQQEREACQGSVFTLLTFSLDLRISASHERWKTDPLRTVCWHWGAWCNSQKYSFVLVKTKKSYVLFVVSSNVVKNSNEPFQITQGIIYVAEDSVDATKYHKTKHE